MPIVPPLRLTAFEYRDRLTAGSLTKPLIVATLDNEGNEHEVVLKVRNPSVNDGHFGPTSLACELVCAILARHLGLAVPDYAVVTVTEGFARAVLDPQIQALLMTNLGENFGTVFLEGYAVLPPPSGDTDLPEAIMSFDGTVLNHDRTHSKPNLLRRGQDVRLIDHSLALPAHVMDDATLKNSPLFDEFYMRLHCALPILKGQGCCFSPIHETWNQVVDAATLDSIHGVIPSSWETKPGDARRIIDFLSNRPSRFSDLQTELTRIAK